MHLIERETEHARAGRPSRHHRQAQRDQRRQRIAEALYRASHAGVPIELIVRGMCVLRPGIPGVSETIRVQQHRRPSFLEHSRIFVFANAGEREVFIGSADWMGRNLDRRVETVVPVLDPALQEHDLRRDPRRLRARQRQGAHPAGRRHLRCAGKPRPGEPRIDAQQMFLSATSVRVRSTQRAQDRVPVALFDRLHAESAPRRSSVMPSSSGIVRSSSSVRMRGNFSTKPTSTIFHFGRSGLRASDRSIRWSDRTG